MENKYQDEVDITSLLKFLYRAVASFFKGIFEIIIIFLIICRKFIIRKKVYLLIGVILGGIIGLLLSNAVPPVYQTSLTVESKFLKGYDFIYEINKLNDYFKEKNYQVVSDIFDAPINNVQSIKEISAESYYSHYNIFEKYGDIEKVDSLRTAEEMNATLFIIELELNENNVIISNIENWIINYLNTNSTLNKNYNVEKNILINSKEKILSELSSLDTLKKGINRKLLSENNSKNSSSLEISLKNDEDILRNPLEIYESDLDFFMHLQRIEKNLNLLEKITVINGVKSVKGNKINHLKKNVLLGSFIGLLIVISIYILISINKYLISFEKKSQKVY
ncbi:hypothetical protein [Chondrinema litorale]|uniref:hypothetical protein n=1 Tax=Chondrinema litorale TaxID=2994555 RepID=UPI0025428E24|nr:hypothetical protein [Chondrinema litorale]UZR94355.1 hypothetical protein OQ292_00805 [Chondrinema litorale]